MCSIFQAKLVRRRLDGVKDTCAAWGLDQLTYGQGVAVKEGHASAYSCSTGQNCEQSSAATLKQCFLYTERSLWALLDWVNHCSQNGEAVCPEHNSCQRLASFNPDKLIGSRRGEGTLWPPYTLIQGDGGWAARLKRHCSWRHHGHSYKSKLLRHEIDRLKSEDRWLLTNSLRTKRMSKHLLYSGSFAVSESCRKEFQILACF